MEQIADSSSAAVVDPDATLGSSAPSTTEDDEQEEYQGNGDVDDASDSNLVAEEANDSISAAGETPKPKRRRFTKGVIEENQGIFPVEYLREYRWPADRHGEFFILQEQVSEYLDILSFKRKYPDLTRREISVEERDYLLREGIVSRPKCNLGLTALRSAEIMDLMASEYPEKYAEYQKMVAEREKQTLANKQKEYEKIKTDATKLAELRQKAIKSAVEWNKEVNSVRQKERKGFFDLQTMIIQRPKRPVKATTNFGAYPVALLPGQYSNWCPSYDSRELNRLPLKTVLDERKHLPRKPILQYAEELLDPEPPRLQTQISQNSANAAFAAGGFNVAGNSSGFAPYASLRRRSSVGGADRGAKLEDYCAFCEKYLYTNDRYMRCTSCDSCGHQACLEFSDEMFELCKGYRWECMECKPCSVCSSIEDEENMLFCDRCDRGYHTYCVGLRALPDGNWICPLFCGGSGTVVRGFGSSGGAKEDEDQIEECSECGRQMSKKKRGRNGLCKECQQ